MTCRAIHVPGSTIDNSGGVGQLDPNRKCIVLDDNVKEVGPGHPGEMYVRGPSICLGYWRNAHTTREALGPDGWLRTGDVAVVKDGQF